MSVNIQDLAEPYIQKLKVYKPGKPIDEVARELGFSDAGAIIKLASNENPLGPSPKAVKAMKKAVSQMHLYPDGSAFYLKKALAGKLNVSQDQLIIGNGGNEILEFIGKLFMDADSDVVFSEYSFAIYGLITGLYKANSVMVPLNNYKHDVDGLVSAITERTKVLFIDVPSNPLGTMISQAEIIKLVDNTPENVIICIDEAYMELLPEESQLSSVSLLNSHPNLIILRTFSKTYGLAGLRVGYAISSKECIALMNRVRQPFNVNAMGLSAALAALGDEQYVAKTRDLIQKELMFITEQLDEMGIEYIPPAANFVTVRVGDGAKVFEQLEKKGVIVRPLTGYELPEYIRVSVGKHSENVKCLETLGNLSL
jgi:histidinol-phosphate aminotransferase